VFITASYFFDITPALRAGFNGRFDLLEFIFRDAHTMQGRGEMGNGSGTGHGATCDGRPGSTNIPDALAAVYYKT
jgi:hypothetical protein